MMLAAKVVGYICKKCTTPLSRTFVAMKVLFRRHGVVRFLCVAPVTHFFVQNFAFLNLNRKDEKNGRL